MVNLPAFIARRLSARDSAGFSAPVVRIAVASVALGISVMILSVSVLLGFQREIREKVTGFAAHIHIDHFDSNSSFESVPVSRQGFPAAEIKAIPGVEGIQAYSMKAGIIKTDDQMQGVVLKGVGPDFGRERFGRFITDGSIVQMTDTAASDGVLLSKTIAAKLMLKTGDPLRMYFLTGAEAQPRGRKFTVTGIYETGLEEFDQVYVIGDLKHITRLNNWEEGQVSGFEVFISDFRQLDPVAGSIYELLPYDLNLEKVTDTYPQVFDWLRLMDMNVAIILTLMIAVSGITIVSTLLILILERTAMIGTLKALGMTAGRIRILFMYLTARIIVSGMVIGNLVAIGVSLLQKYTHFFPLDRESYYIDHVPVALDILPILLINAGTFVLCMIMIIAPGYVIGRITPVRAMRTA
jgi:lipoprotein-releasing system permease protein